MPDILEINKAIQAEWMGAKVGLNVYEWINAESVVQCPQIVVDIPNENGIHRVWLQIHPDGWADVTIDFIVHWFKAQLKEIN